MHGLTLAAPPPLDGEILGPEDGVRVVVAMHAMGKGRETHTLPAGLSILELFGLIDCPTLLALDVVALIGPDEVPRDMWDRVRLKPGTTLVMIALPEGDDALRFALLAAIVVVAIVAPELLLSEAFLASGGIGALAASAGISTAIGIGGMLLVNALVPAAQEQLGSGSGIASPSALLQGARNTARLYKVIPDVLGKHDQVPPLGALTFTEVVGSDQYLRILLVWGYGPILVTDVTIGETDIATFEGIEIEHRQGLPGDQPHTLFGDSVFEESLDTLVDQASDWIIKTSQINADELSVDLTWKTGLVVFASGSGDKINDTVDFEIQFRAVGAGGWTDISQGMFDAGAATFPASAFTAGSPSSVAIQDRRAETIRHGFRWAAGARDQYEVRIRRTTADTSSSRHFNAFHWTAIRTIRNDPPINMPEVATTAIRLKATGEVNGIVDTIKATCSRLMLDWDGATWVADQETSNPASVFRLVAQGPANRLAVADARVDLAGLEAWHDYCVAEGLSFNQIIDFKTTTQTTLQSIAAAGRAGLAKPDGKWGVVIDRAQSIPAQAFTSRNIWAYNGSRLYLDRPHAVKVPFLNEEKGFRQDERIVYADGFDVGTATLFETVEYPGVTDPAQIYYLARIQMAEAALRPETHTFNTDIDHLAATRGDMVRFSHDVPVTGLARGRIKSITDNGTHATDLILDEDVTYEVGKNYNVRIRYADLTQRVFVLDNIGGTGPTLTLTTPELLATAPGVGDLAMFGETGLESAELLVLGIRPGADGSARLTCTNYNGAVYTAPGSPIPSFSSNLGAIPGLITPAVERIQSDENVLIVNPDGSQQPRIVVTFAYASNRNLSLTAQIEGQIRVSGSQSAWQSVFAGDPTAVTMIFAPVEAGESYDLRFRFVGVTGEAGPFGTTSSETVIGDSFPPAEPVAFTVSRLADGTRRFEWALEDPAPPDVLVGGGVKLRWFLGATADWNAMTALHTGLLAASPYETNALAAGTYTFAAKTFDRSGNESTNPIFINSAVIGDPRLRNVLIHRTEQALGWPGAKTDCFENSDGHLQATTTGSWSGLPGTWSGLASTWQAIATNNSPIRYETPVLDLLTDVTSSPLITVGGTGSQTLEMRTHTDAEGSDLSAEAWVAITQIVGQRYVQFRFSLADTLPLMTSAEIILDGELLVDDFNDINMATESASWFQRIAAGHVRVGVREEVAGILLASITAIQNVGAGWTSELISKSAAIPGFGNDAAEFKVYNGSGALADATIDVTLKGPKAM